MRVVIKLGTTTVTHSTGRLNIRRIEKLCKVISDIKNAGNEILLVSSGAIGMGMGKLRLDKRPADVPSRQAAAAVGQCELMYTYDRLFGKHNHVVGQMLLTAEDINHNGRRHNVEATLFRLLEMDVLPIINENDTVATAEIEGGEIGDNDTLSAIVAVSAKADLLIILSDIEGLYTADPRTDKSAKLIPVVTHLSEDILALAGGVGSGLGTGGMQTKLFAARMLEENGIDMLITNGQNPDCLYDIFEGKNVGTRFSFKGLSDKR